LNNLAVALAGVALLAAPAFGQPAQTNSPAPSGDAKPPASAGEQAQAPAAPAAPADPKPASTDEGSGQPAPDKPAADDNPSR
jgi:hypothetical protein